MFNAEKFIKKAVSNLKKEIKGISTEVMKRFMEYSWPGNVRELENAIERAILLATGDVLEISDFLPSTFKPKTSEAYFTLPEEVLSIKAASRVIERDLIGRALAKAGGNKTKAARTLEISRPILISKIKEYNLE